MRRPPRRHAQLHLPPLDGEEACHLVALLEKAIRAIWRAHGDAMADVIGRDHPAPETLDDRSGPESEPLPLFDDHDIDF